VITLFLAAPLLCGSAPLDRDGARVDLADLAFMAGCWEGTFQAERGIGTIEEHYTTPSENLMLGTTRYIVDGRTVMFEFSKLEAADGAIVLTPYPRGQASEHGFRLTMSAEGEATFEAPEHDFPKRIRYRRDDETLVARVDDGTDEDERGSEWRMGAAPCK
jgi:hypothetical protein